MINRVVLTGRLTKDIELRYTSSNIAVVKFTLAVDRTFKADNAERGCDYIQIVAWRKQAENASKYIGKGSLVGIDGCIETGSYDNKDNVRVYTTEVVADSIAFLDPKNQGNDAQREFKNVYDENRRKESTPTIDVAEDDLPF